MTPKPTHDDDLLKLAEAGIEPEDGLPQPGATLAQPADLDEAETQEIDIDALLGGFDTFDDCPKRGF